MELCERDLAFIWLTRDQKPRRDAHMFVIDGMEKVRCVIGEKRKRKLTRHKKISNNTVIEIDHCSPLEIVTLQKNLLRSAGSSNRWQRLLQRMRA